MRQETGLGVAVLDDPVASALWSVRHPARRDAGISAGDVVLAGSLIRPIEAPAGSGFEASFGSFGSVALTFA